MAWPTEFSDEVVYSLFDEAIQIVAASRLLPKVYGEKVEHSGPDGSGMA